VDCNSCEEFYKEPITPIWAPGTNPPTLSMKEVATKRQLVEGMLLRIDKYSDKHFIEILKANCRNLNVTIQIGFM
jgi:hypothetical protein